MPVVVLKEDGYNHALNQINDHDDDNDVNSNYFNNNNNNNYNTSQLI